MSMWVLAPFPGFPVPERGNAAALVSVHILDRKSNLTNCKVEVVAADICRHDDGGSFRDSDERDVSKTQFI